MHVLAEHGMATQTAAAQMLVLRSTGSRRGSFKVAGHKWAPDSWGGPTPSSPCSWWVHSFPSRHVYVEGGHLIGSSWG